MRSSPSTFTRKQAETQLRQALASATDDRLLALTAPTLARTYRLKEREIEAILLAAQNSRRRFLAEHAA